MKRFVRSVLPWLASGLMLLTGCDRNTRYENTPAKPAIGYVNPQYLDDIEIDRDTTALPVSTTALLVIDVQPEYSDPEGTRGNAETDYMAKVIDSLTPIFRKANMTTVNVYMDTKTNAKEVKFYRYHPSENDIFIGKRTDSPFQSSAIDDTLQVHGKQNVFLMGFNLVACVMGTALDAKMRGYDVYVVIDASGNDNKNLKAGPEVDKNLRYMQKEGIRFIYANDALKRLK